MKNEQVLPTLEEAMLELNEEKALDLVHQALSQNIDPFAITNTLGDAMKLIGDKFSSGECYIPELILSGEIFKKAMNVLEPEFKGKEARKAKGKVVLGTVKGDLHDLGLKLVALTFSMNGFDVVNLGKDVSTERFVDEVREKDPHILGLSALLTTTLNQQRAVIQALQSANLRENVRIMIGGAPVTQEWADEIGADAVGFDAVDGLEKANKLIEEHAA